MLPNLEHLHFKLYLKKEFMSQTRAGDVSHLRFKAGEQKAEIQNLWNVKWLTDWKKATEILLRQATG